MPVTLESQILPVWTIKRLYTIVIDFARVIIEEIDSVFAVGKGYQMPLIGSRTIDYSDIELFHHEHTILWIIQTTLTVVIT